MKKFVSFALLVALLSSLISLSAAASEGLSDLSEVTVNRDGLVVLRYYKDGARQIARTPDMSDEDIDFLLDIFSDKNLVFESYVENSSELEASELPKNYLHFKSEDEYDDWTIRFDEKRVFVKRYHFGEVKDTTYCSWFAYNDDNIYERFAEYFDTAYIKIRESNLQRQEEQAEERAKYEIKVSDFQYIYTAKAPMSIGVENTLEWGVCSYIKEGESQATMAIYAVYLSYSDDNTMEAFIYEKNPVENKVIFDRKLLIYIYNDEREGAITIDSNPTNLYDLEVECDEDMHVTGVVMGNTRVGHERITEELDMDLYAERGNLPEGLFVPIVNANPTAEPKAAVEPKATAKPKDEEEKDGEKDKAEQEEQTTSSPEKNDEEITAPSTDDKIILTIGKKEAKVFGKAKDNDVAPVIRMDRTMLPARFVAENLGAEVEWNEAERKVKITKDDIEILIYIDSDAAYVNGRSSTLDSPAFIENERTYTPLRFIAEALGARVDWNEADEEVIITR